MWRTILFVIAAASARNVDRRTALEEARALEMRSHDGNDDRPFARLPVRAFVRPYDAYPTEKRNDVIPSDELALGLQACCGTRAATAAPRHEDATTMNQLEKPVAAPDYTEQTARGSIHTRPEDAVVYVDTTRPYDDRRLKIPQKKDSTVSERSNETNDNINKTVHSDKRYRTKPQQEGNKNANRTKPSVRNDDVASKHNKTENDASGIRAESDKPHDTIINNMSTELNNRTKAVDKNCTRDSSDEDVPRVGGFKKTDGRPEDVNVKTKSGDDDYQWIWSVEDVTSAAPPEVTSAAPPDVTTATLPDVTNRNTFNGDQCATGKVRVGNMCVPIDM